MSGADDICQVTIANSFCTKCYAKQKQPVAVKRVLPSKVESML